MNAVASASATPRGAGLAARGRATGQGHEGRAHAAHREPVRAERGGEQGDDHGIGVEDQRGGGGGNRVQRAEVTDGVPDEDHPQPPQRQASAEGQRGRASGEQGEENARHGEAPREQARGADAGGEGELGEDRQRPVRHRRHHDVEEPASVFTLARNESALAIKLGGPCGPPQTPHWLCHTMNPRSLSSGGGSPVPRTPHPGHAARPRSWWAL